MAEERARRAALAILIELMVFRSCKWQIAVRDDVNLLSCELNLKAAAGSSPDLPTLYRRNFAERKRLHLLHRVRVSHLRSQAVKHDQ